ncbi:glycosyltransferase family 2 protein [Elusimicrobiota bacterium]
MNISVVIPVYNEEANIEPLYKRLTGVLEQLQGEYEILVIDDGSKDNTNDILRRLAEKDKKLKVIKFSRNYGQTAALQAGFKTSSGEIIVTMDGDLQNNPEDIPGMLQEMGRGNTDVVSGWRYPRRDSFPRRIVSSIANLMISKICGLKLHDYGCTLKVYRSRHVKDLDLYGEMHRFIPAFINWNGGKVIETKVSHNPRVHGKSSYGMTRIHRVVLDLITTKFLTTYSSKPIHIFGAMGLFSIFLGISTTAYVIIRRVYMQGHWMSPLFFISVFLLGLGLIFILMGIIAEIAVRIYFSFENKVPYKIDNEINS